MTRAASSIVAAPGEGGIGVLLWRCYAAIKPERTYANAFAGAAGALFAALALGAPDWLRIAWAVIATMLVVAGACTLNNFFDRTLDGRMRRTASRALPQGLLPPALVLALGIILAALGFALALPLGALPLLALIAGFVIYLAAYGPLKRVTIESTLVGSIAGAMPIVAGYAAIARSLDARALVLALVLVTWQMGHFYAITLYRQADYAAGGIPTLPSVRGVRFTRIAIMGYAVLYLAATLAMGALGEGWTYLASAALLGCGWIARGALTPFDPSPEAWGRAMFLYSLIALLAWCIALPLGLLLP